MVRQTISRLERATVLDSVSDRLQGVVQRVAKPQRLRDLLHGTWLGHPVHPVLVQVPVGAFMSAAVLDVLPGQRRAATTLIAFGTVSAVPAIAAGLVRLVLAVPGSAPGRAGARGAPTRWRSVSTPDRWPRASRGGAAWAASSRTPGSRRAGGGAYLGGHLSYEQGAGMNQAAAELLRMPEDWAEVGELPHCPRASRRRGRSAASGSCCTAWATRSPR